MDICIYATQYGTREHAGNFHVQGFGLLFDVIGPKVAVTVPRIGGAHYYTVQTLATNAATSAYGDMFSLHAECGVASTPVRHAASHRKYPAGTENTQWPSQATRCDLRHFLSRLPRAGRSRSSHCACRFTGRINTCDVAGCFLIWR